MAVVVTYYATQTARLAKEALREFTIRTEPENIPEVPETLKGKKNAEGKDLYEMAVERRAEKVEKAIYDCKCAALDEVRKIVGSLGVLVATLVKEDELVEKSTEEKEA